MVCFYFGGLILIRNLWIFVCCWMFLNDCCFVLELFGGLFCGFVGGVNDEEDVICGDLECGLVIFLYCWVSGLVVLLILVRILIVVGNVVGV